MAHDLFRQKAKAIVASYGGLVPFDVLEKDQNMSTAYAQSHLDESMRAILEEDSSTFLVVLHFGNPIIATVEAHSNKFLNLNKDVTSEGHAHLQQQKSGLPDGKSSAMQGWRPPHPNAVSRPQQFQAPRQARTGHYNPYESNQARGKEREEKREEKREEEREESLVKRENKREEKSERKRARGKEREEKKREELSNGS